MQGRASHQQEQHVMVALPCFQAAGVWTTMLLVPQSRAWHRCTLGAAEMRCASDLMQPWYKSAK